MPCRRTGLWEQLYRAGIESARGPLVTLVHLRLFYWWIIRLVARCSYVINKLKLFFVQYLYLFVIICMRQRGYIFIILVTRWVEHGKEQHTLRSLHSIISAPYIHGLKWRGVHWSSAILCQRILHMQHEEESTKGMNQRSADCEEEEHGHHTWCKFHGSQLKICRT